MRGKHHIVIETARLKYEFEIKRNITVIQGDSATGKTTLVDLLSAYAMDGKESGVRLESDVKCSVMSADGDTWKTVLSAYHDQIVFFDEYAPYIFSKDFAGAIQGTSNYYVFITRKPLTELPYSINEIYGIRTSGKYHYPQQVYHEFYEIYSESNAVDIEDYSILTEDKRAGYQFFERIFGADRCISAEGNAKIYDIVEDIDKPLFIIVDGAAFGAYIAKTMAAIKQRDRVALYMPESFEWLILRAGILSIDNLETVLSAPENYIDSAEYLSWERFFTEYLKRSTENDPICQYSKEKLKEFYTSGKNKERIMAIIPGIA